MQAGAPMIIFYALSTLSTSILQGMGKFREPLIHCAVALVGHIVVLFVLLREFNQNIYGVIYANIFFALIVCVLNAIAISRSLRYRQEIYRTFLIPLASSAIMAFVVYGVYNLFALFAGNAVSVLISVLFGIVFYGFVMVAFRGITKQELLRIPGGRLIIRLYTRIGLMR